ncbi:hypothetical protein AX17_006954 [Amanita inopinata Kibby_2008]|nr:hypothetical protein AX17_006954 [Amanita inopinata Kibby_2008]
MARKTLFGFVRDQWRPVPPLVTTNLSGRTVVIIGANTGLGLEAAKHFARMNPGRLILGCRDQQKGEAAVSKIRAETGYEQPELLLIDLSKFSSVKSFADKFKAESDRLDYLILSAGIGSNTYEVTADGWESALQVNCLSLFLLAILLFPTMMQTSKKYDVTPRLVLVGSEVHFWTSFDKQVLESNEPVRLLGSKKYCTNKTMARRYLDTKLVDLLFIRALASRLSSDILITNCVNPGFCYSELRRNISGFRAFMSTVMEKFLAFTTEQGSRQLVWAALGGDDKDEKLHGAYISRSQAEEPSDFVLSEQGQKMQGKLWIEIMEILSKIDSRVTTVTEQFLQQE